jgi:ribosome-associated heat shock protein Hsp15
LSEHAPGLRLDKWLWFARIVKTRALAQELATKGRVRVNSERTTNAAKIIRPGDVLTISLPSRVRVLKVLDVAERRGPASETTHLYEDMTAANNVQTIQN